MLYGNEDTTYIQGLMCEILNSSIYIDDAWRPRYQKYNRALRLDCLPAIFLQLDESINILVLQTTHLVGHAGQQQLPWQVP